MAKAFTEQSERQQVQAIDEVRRQRRLQRAEDLKAFMRTEAGRRIAYWIIYELAGLQDASYHRDIKYGGERFDAYIGGRRDVAIELHNELQRLAPDQVGDMVIEQIRAIKADLALEDNSSTESPE